MRVKASSRGARFMSGVAVVGVTIVAAGCGSSSSGGGSQLSTGNSGSSSNKALIQKDIAAYNSLVGTAPKIVGSSASFSVSPLKKKPPTGKLVDIINCTVPVCNDYTNGAEQAAKILDWRTKVVTTQLSPQGWRQAWTTVLQDKPNVIIFGGIAPTAGILDLMKRATSQGAIIAAYSVDRHASSSGPIAFETDSPAEFVEQGEAQALGAIADAKAAPSVVILTDPGTPSWIPMRAEIKKVIGAVDGTTDVLDVSESNIGKTVPTQLVSYLQSHPTVKYVLPSFDDFLPGIPEALKNAGLTSVKVLGTSASNSSLGLVRSDQMYSSVVHMTGAKGMWLVYGAAAVMTGQPPSNLNPPGPIAIATKADAAQFGSDISFWPSSAKSIFQQALAG